MNYGRFRGISGRKNQKFSSFAHGHLLKTQTVRKIIFLCLGLWLCGLNADADTFQLTDGRAVTGEPLFSVANDAGLKIKTGDDQYENVPWTSFTQEELKKFQQTPKLAPLVGPFIEITEQEKRQKTEVKINPVDRLDRPEAHSLLGGLFSSGLGIVILLLIYAGNIYAAFEIALFRGRPAAVVCGLSTVLPVIGPILFLSLPTLSTHGQEPESEFEPVAAATPPSVSPLSPDPTPGTARAPHAGLHTPHPSEASGGLHLAQAEAAPENPELPATQTFQRGAFTFNRRFFETKFPGFFGVVRRHAEQHLVIVIKSARGEYTGDRILRISTNELHLQVHKGAASQEVMIPFTEIKEVQLKHEDSK